MKRYKKGFSFSVNPQLRCPDIRNVEFNKAVIIWAPALGVNTMHTTVNGSPLAVRSSASSFIGKQSILDGFTPNLTGTSSSPPVVNIMECVSPRSNEPSWERTSRRTWVTIVYYVLLCPYNSEYAKHGNILWYVDRSRLYLFRTVLNFLYSQWVRTL